MADKFDFNGQLLERGNRVIADIDSYIEINTIDDPSESAVGYLEIENQGPDLPRKLKMSLNLPPGQPGAEGKMPKIGVTFSYPSQEQTQNPSVTIRESEDSQYDYILDFILPKGTKGDRGPQGDRGPAGNNGRTPNISLTQAIDILQSGADPYVTVRNTDGVDKEFELHLPPGPRGERGEKGDPFTINYIYRSFNEMLTANTQGVIKAGELALVTAHTNEPDAKLYQKTLDGSDSGAEISALTGTGIAFLSVFSGAKGTGAKVTSVSITSLNSNQTASVTNTTTLNENTDTNETAIALRIPKGASSTIASTVNVSTLNSKSNATAAASTTYDSTTDKNITTLSLGIPKGTPSTISNTVNVSTLNPGSNATASANTVYDSTNDQNITTLSLGIPRGTMPTIATGTIDTTGNTPAYAEIIPNPQIENQYLLNMSLPQGPQGPQGETGPAGQGSISDITTTGNYTAVTSITTANEGTTLAVSKSGIPASDVTSGSFAVNRGGTGKTTHTLNSILTGNNTSAINNVSTGNGAFYATATGAAAQFGTLPIAQGGTGATTAAGVRNTLGLGNTTGAVPVANGGTGATTAAAARTNLGVDTAINTAVSNFENIIDQIVVVSNTEPSSEHTKI